MADQLKSPRVIVLNETDSEKSGKKQADWLAQHYPGFKLIQMANVNQNNRIYNRVTFNTANGQRQVVLFDVSASYLNNLSTSMRVFPEGTMVRLWPRSGSTPTRIQIIE